MRIRKIRFSESFQPGRIDFSEFGLRQVAPLESEGVAALVERTGAEFSVEGRYKVRFEVDCDRCLTPAPLEQDRKFDLFYCPAPQEAGETEKEIDSGEAEVGYYEDDGLELAEILREQVLLAMPLQRTCREDCKGICPVCGVDRNEVNCDCATPAADDRWNALRNLTQ